MRSIPLLTRLLPALMIIAPLSLAQPPAPNLPDIEPSDPGVAYAEPMPAGSEGHLLDIYMPPVSHEGSLPVVIWTGGSAWMAENGRMTAGFVAEALNPEGYAVVGVSIRSSDNATFPGQLHDIKAAIRWLRANAGPMNIDPDRIAIMGDSSGGWTAVMAALTGNNLELEGDAGVTGHSSAVSAAIAFYPPTDFLQMDAHAIGGCENGKSDNGGFCHDGADSPESRLLGCPIQNCPDKVAQANPITWIDEEEPPIMLLHGGNDPLVPHHQSELLFDALSEAGHDVTMYSLPHAGHGPYWGFLTDEETQRDATGRCSHDCRMAGPVDEAPTWRTVIEFLLQNL